MPPPLLPAELPLTVQLVSVAVPAMMPPPLVPGGVAADGAVGQRRRGGADAAAVAAAELPLTVLLVSVAVAAKMPPPSIRGDVAPDRAVPDGEHAAARYVDAAAAEPATLRATVVRTSVTFAVPGTLEMPPPAPEARFPVTTQSRTTRSAFADLDAPAVAGHVPVADRQPLEHDLDRTRGRCRARRTRGRSAGRR